MLQNLFSTVCRRHGRTSAHVEWPQLRHIQFCVFINWSVGFSALLLLKMPAKKENGFSELWGSVWGNKLERSPPLVVSTDWILSHVIFHTHRRTNTKRDEKWKEMKIDGKLLHVFGRSVSVDRRKPFCHRQVHRLHTEYSDTDRERMRERERVRIVRDT